MLATYKATSCFPTNEQYGLTSQIRRACVSIPANIAEGCGKSGGADLGRFLQIAFGSACELEYHFLLSNELQFLNNAEYDSLSSQLIEVKRMLTSLIQKIRLKTTTESLNTVN